MAETLSADYMSLEDLPNIALCSVISSIFCLRFPTGPAILNKSDEIDKVLVNCGVRF